MNIIRSFARNDLSIGSNRFVHWDRISRKLQAIYLSEICQLTTYGQFSRVHLEKWAQPWGFKLSKVKVFQLKWAMLLGLWPFTSRICGSNSWEPAVLGEIQANQTNNQQHNWPYLERGTWLSAEEQIVRNIYIYIYRYIYMSLSLSLSILLILI